MLYLVRYTLKKYQIVECLDFILYGKKATPGNFIIKNISLKIKIHPFSHLISTRWQIIRKL